MTPFCLTATKICFVAGLSSIHISSFKNCYGNTDSSKDNIASINININLNEVEVVHCGSKHFSRDSKTLSINEVEYTGQNGISNDDNNNITLQEMVVTSCESHEHLSEDRKPLKINGVEVTGNNVSCNEEEDVAMFDGRLS